MERALAVVVATQRTKKDNWLAEDLSREFDELLRSARLRVEGRVRCNLKEPSPSHLLGRGKVEEIRGLAAELGVDTVVFSENLSATQQKNIEEAVEVKTIDRTQLILDIFARHARSGEGKIQVELAQLEYLLPRLSGKGIILSRLGGGIGTRGPGEQKLEVDRRRIRTRIAKLKKDLDSVERQRSTRRKKREQFSVLSVAIIGYTNAGKSTLLNRLTNAGITSGNALFSTLDPTIRKYTLPDNQNVLFIDTVGFIYKLPHSLIDAFKATLEEVVEADILLNVLDISHPKVREQNEATYSVLEELKVKEKPVITVLNKSDRIEEEAARQHLRKEFGDGVMISAANGENIGELIDRIMLYAGRLTTIVKLEVPVSNMRLLHLIYNHGKVRKRIDKEDSVYIEAQVPQGLMERLKQLEGA
jgi:GTP-binding protein HflX